MARPNQSREKLLEAAAFVAAERGVSATTVDEIAERAGVAKGSFYYNFASKEEIFETLIERAVSDTVEGVRAARTEATGSQVAAIATAFVQRVGERAHRTKVVFAELLRTDRPWHESLQRHRSALLEEIRLAILADGGDATMLKAAAVFGAIVMVSFERTVFDPDRSVEECVAAIVGT